MSAKGYVVRGTWDTGPVVCHVPGGFWHDRSPHVFQEIEFARSQRGLMLQQGCTDVTILAVAEDGTETPLPSYEEALAEISGADTVLTLVGQPPDGRRLILRITDAMGAAGDMLRGAHAEIARLRTTERPEEKRLREAVAAMRRLLREPEREGIPGFADVCAALDALHRALWGPSGRLADRDAKGAD